MKYNIFNIFMMILIVLLQIMLPIAEGGRTYFSYIIPWLSLITKFLFILKLFGIPVPAKLPITGELGIYFFTMFFFLSALYKKGFVVYPLGIIINIICLVVMLAAIIVEDSIFIYEYRKEVNEDD